MDRFLRKYLTRNFFFDLLMISIGSAMWVIGVLAFTLPNGLLSIGFTGVIMVVNHFIPQIPISIGVYILNVPFIFWAWKELNKRFLFWTFYAVTLQSVLLEVLKNMPTYTGDVLLAAIFAGVIGGIGSGLVIRRGGSGGGVEIIGIIVKKRLGYSVGTVGMIFNVCIVSCCAFIFGMVAAMYTIIFIALCAIMTDKAIAGLGKKYTAMIVTEYPEKMKNAIFDRLHRGVTFLNGRSAFSGDRRDVIYCAINQYELATLKDMIYTIDPNVFMTITETTEIYGHFRNKKGDALTAAQVETNVVEYAQQPVTARIDKDTPTVRVIDKDREVVDERVINQEGEESKLHFMKKKQL